jgi:glycosyltransferase involved in cell wall biosynthesis
MDKVLHLYSDWSVDGPAEIVVNLCSALASKWRVLLIHDDSDDPGDCLTARIQYAAPKKGVSVEAPFPLPKHYAFTKMLVSGLRLSSYLKKSGIRLMHTHRLADHSVAAVASYGSRVPIIRSVYYERPPDKFRERFLLQHFAEAIVVPSNQTRANFINALPGLESKLWVIRPGVDTRRFDPTRIDRGSARSRFQFADDEYVVGLVSRVRPTRKVEIAVEALSLASKEIPRLRLFVLGGGKHRNIRRTLSDPGKRHRISEQVVHISYLKGEDYVKALAAMDVGLFLEPGSDKSGRAVREYMAMGLPVIGCENALLSGLVVDGENGRIVNANSKGVANALIELAKDQKLSKELGMKNFEKIREGFSLAHQARDTSALYESVVNNGVLERFHGLPKDLGLTMPQSVLSRADKVIK